MLVYPGAGFRAGWPQAAENLRPRPRREADEAIVAVTAPLGLGPIVALCYRSFTLYFLWIYTRFTVKFGTSVSETTMRPNAT